ncbi:MAG: FAD-dependent oxidoreductase [Desulfobacca sp. 4484_104]|nr:MAG: FAD-dependent oxidoreductase [Desulfobacca sp. 4484_104]RLA90643.1 MAG: FAD-dependent oxidoreductase [Deltaproteobacteria bacterium]
MAQDYDIIIIGAGPAGLFAALTLAELNRYRILIVEQGKDLQARQHRGPGDLLCGWGGAGAYSDGKLMLTPEVGGFLAELLPLPTLQKLIQEADAIYVQFGAPERLYGGDSEALELLEARARHAGMILVPTRLRHIGTENCLKVLTRLRAHLEGQIDIRTNCRVSQILATEQRVQGVELATGEHLTARFVIAAPGRAGAEWIRQEALRLGIPSIPSPVDIGVRVEAPASVLAPLTEAAYEAKLIYYSRTFDDKVRTFCMNPYGEVVLEDLDGLLTVNGHSYTYHKSENTNFAVLVSSTFTEPFDDPISYGRYIARLANLLGNGALVQRLGDLQSGRRSTPARLARCTTTPTLPEATPGDLSFVLPYRYLIDILEMLKAMDCLAPGINSRHTLIYGVEVKFYSHRLKLTPQLESSVPNLFIIGDGAGISRGLVQASVSGLCAARAIAVRS